MKQYLANGLMSLVTGLAFATGIALVIMAYAWNESRHGQRGEWVNSPNHLTIISDSQVPNMMNFTVQGVVENSGEVSYNSISLEILIRAGDAIVNECTTSVGQVDAMSKKAFTSECRNVAGTNLPQNVSYEISINSAQTRKPCGNT